MKRLIQLCLSLFRQVSSKVEKFDWGKINELLKIFNIFYIIYFIEILLPIFLGEIVHLHAEVLFILLLI